MTSEKRKILDVSIAPKKLNQFRESLQSTYDNCDAISYVDYISHDVRLKFHIHHQKFS